MMHGNDFLTLAGKLAAQTAYGAAGYRSSVSRAYYGAYHLARSYLADANIHCPKNCGNEHLWIQRMFRQCDLEEGIEVGIALSNLHESRKAADYELENLEIESQANAQLCSLRADEIRSRIDDCSRRAIASQIEAGIRKYKRLVREE